MRVWWLCITLLMVTLPGPACAQQIEVSKENRTIAITTSEEASALADTAVMTIGFQIFGKEQQATYDDAARISNAIVAALVNGGVPKTAVESTGQAIQPIGLNGDDEKARYAEGFRFSFSQDWRLTVPASQAAEALALAVSAGATSSGNIVWELRQEDALQAEAAAKALAHAQEIGVAMAKGLGARLGSLVYASNQTPAQRFMVSSQTVSVAAAPLRALVQARPLAITPQRIAKSATVYAVFAIE